MDIKTYHLVRIIFARLPSGGEIQKHVDTEKLFGSHHRVHVPVVTSNNNIFEVMDKRIEMNEGSVIEINNCREHYCINKDKNDRIHLIFDMGKGHRKKTEQNQVNARSN